MQHGAMVASVAAARGGNGVGMAGAAYLGRVDLVDPRLRDSMGGPIGSAAAGVTIAAHADSLVRRGARVINISLAISVNRNNAADLQDAVTLVQWMMLAGSVGGRPPLFVLSSGNHGGDPRDITFPLMKDEDSTRVLVVTASTRSGGLLTAAVGSPYIDLAAPGDSVGVLRPTNQTGTATSSGASFAAPLVSGLAAMLAGFDPQLTAQELRQLILRGAIGGGVRAGGGSGYRVPDAYESLRIAGRKNGARLCGNKTYLYAEPPTSGNRIFRFLARRDSSLQPLDTIANLLLPEDSLFQFAGITHGGRELVSRVVGSTPQAYQVFARHNGTQWQILPASWPSISAPSFSGSSNSSQGRSHGGDSLLTARFTLASNPALITADVGIDAGGAQSAPLATFANIPDLYNDPVSGILYGGAATEWGTMSPLGGFAITAVGRGTNYGTTSFYRFDLSTLALSHIFDDPASVRMLSLCQATCSWVPAPMHAIGISEDGSEFWYAVPNGAWGSGVGCTVKRYSLKRRQLTTDVAIAVPGCFWMEGSARVAGVAPWVGHARR
ncbi:MAG: S8 family serine peptidase [Gemmatimonadaceae bacterium]|nr:S8 family serine peptidase [Gemmatimonadaceae bacterium]